MGQSVTLQRLKVPNCPPGLLLPKKWKEKLFPSQSLQAGDGEAASLVHLPVNLRSQKSPRPGPLDSVNRVLLAVVHFERFQKHLLKSFFLCLFRSI